MPRWSRAFAVPLLLAASACAPGGDGPVRAPDDLPWGDRPADRLAFAAREAIDRGEPRAALARLDEALALDPRHVDARRLRQDVLRERGRRGLLTVEAERAVASAPDDAIAHYLRGRIVEVPADKLACFERAVELAPQSVWPWLGLAHTLRAADPARSLAIYERLFAVTRGHPLVAAAYAGALRDTKQFDRAARVYEAMRADDRARGAAELGLAQLALQRNDEDSAWRRLVAGLRLRPFDPTAQALANQWLDAGASDGQAAELLDLVREEPGRARVLAQGAGAPLLGALLRRSGRPLAMRALLEAADVDARDVDLRRLQRRNLLALGDVAAFLALARADVPRVVVAPEQNRVRSRWLALLDGPWHARDPLAAGAGDVCVRLLAALRDCGWLHEAELLADAALRAHPDHAAAIATLRDECGRQLAFEGELRRRLYDGYRRRDGADVAALLEGLRGASSRIFGRDVVGQPTVFRAPLVGEMLDPFAGGLAEHFDRYNRHLVLGRRAGAPVEGMLHTRWALQDLPDAKELALAARCSEVIVCDRDIRPLHGVWGGDIAGVALLNHFLVDFDSVRGWAGAVADKRRIAAEDGMSLLQDTLPVQPGLDPFDVDWRLEVASPVVDADLETALLDTVRHHERQHLVDWLYYLPIEDNVWRAFGLLFDFGFSPARIEAEMERRAELASLAVSPHTELVLAHIADYAAAGDVPSPHAKGFAALAADLAAALVEDGVPPELAAPAQWHRAPMASVRKAALRLLGTLPSSSR